MYGVDTVWKYTYTNNNQILEEKSKQRYTYYNYNEAGQLISMDVYEDWAMFSSNSAVIEASRIRTEWTNPENTEISHTTNYEYNAAGQLTKSTNYLGSSIYSYDKKNRISRLTFHHDNNISNYFEFKYDRKGNLIERNGFQVFGSGEKALANKTLFEFDNKHNPYQAFHNLPVPGINTNPNNIIKTADIHFFMIEGVEDQTSSSEDSFKYNTQGFPVTKNDRTKYLYEEYSY